VLWTDHEQPNMPGVVIEPIPPLKNQALYDAAEAHAPKNIGQFKADVLRYELLLYRGGVYVDADFECRKALDSLLVGVDCFAAWETDRHWVNNAIMGAVPGEPFFQMLVEGLPANVATMRGRSPNVMTGPQFVTQTYRRTLEFHKPRCSRRSSSTRTCGTNCTATARRSPMPTRSITGTIGAAGGPRERLVARTARGPGGPRR